MELARAKRFALPEFSSVNSAADSAGLRLNFIVVATALLAAGLKMLIALRTLGTNDVATFYQFSRMLTEHGLQWTYQHTISFNHPPLTAYFLKGIYWLDHHGMLREYGLAFPFWLRLPGIIADFVVVLVLCRFSETVRSIPGWGLVLLAVTPVSIMISGFHGNTDSIMVMFLVLAAYGASRERQVFCGIFFALSCQIKIVALLFLPLLFFFWFARGKGLSFIISVSVVCAIGWAEPLLGFPGLFFRNVISYGSWWGLWGLTYWLRLTAFPQFSVVTFIGMPLYESIVSLALKICVIASVLAIAWRRRCLGPDRMFDSFAYIWLVFFVVAPGICAQYMVWLAPFILVLSPTLSAWLVATSSVFLFFFYNIISGGLPWYFANSTSELNTVWTPWSLWPWAAMIVGLILLWRKAITAEPNLRLLSCKPVT